MTSRILIVDDHAMVAMALQVSFAAVGWAVEVVNAEVTSDVVRRVTEYQPHCVLLDLNLGSAPHSGLDLISPIGRLGASVVMLTGETDRHVLARCVHAGALGWISKQASLDEVIGQVRDVLVGRPLMGMTFRESLLAELRSRQTQNSHATTRFQRLTPRERTVLAALMDGQSAEEISSVLFVSVSTVRSQIRSVLQKLNVHSQVAAVSIANRSGWTP